MEVGGGSSGLSNWACNSRVIPRHYVSLHTDVQVQVSSEGLTAKSATNITEFWSLVQNLSKSAGSVILAKHCAKKWL